MAKKYFWLKLKEDFFRDKRIKKMRKVAGGDTYTLIYLKMQLLSLKNEGILLYEGVEEDFAEEVALEIDEDADNVRFTIMFLEKNGLLEEMKDNEYALLETMESIGSETQGADRVRRHRELQKKTKLALQCNTSVTECNTEIDIEIDIEKDIEKDNIKDNVTSVPLPVSEENEKYPFKEVIDYLNKSANKGFKYVASHKKHIVARFKEGFTLEEFKKVIEVKTHQWLNDPKNNIYLRPETLFGNKMDGYLQEYYKPNNGQKKYQQPTQQVTSIKQPISFTPTEPDENGFNGCNFEISWIGKRNIDHNLIIHYYKEHIKNTGSLLKSGGREITVQELIEEIEWDRKVKVSV